jgi:hypothetical protein
MRTHTHTQTHIYIYIIQSARFEVSTAVTMKNAVFWNVALCISCVNRGFRRNLSPPSSGQACSLQPPAHPGSPLTDFSTLKIKAICSSEMSVHATSTQRHTQEDGIHHHIICIHTLNRLVYHVCIFYCSYLHDHE